jgi:hypothetical protein
VQAANVSLHVYFLFPFDTEKAIRDRRAANVFLDMKAEVELGDSEFIGYGQVDEVSEVSKLQDLDGWRWFGDYV